MLNLTLVQKLFSAFRNVHHKGSKNFVLQSCVNSTGEKPITTKGVTRTDDRLVSHFPLDDVDSEISPNQFYIWQKTGCGI